MFLADDLWVYEDDWLLEQVLVKTSVFEYIFAQKFPIVLEYFILVGLSVLTLPKYIVQKHLIFLALPIEFEKVGLDTRPKQVKIFIKDDIFHLVINFVQIHK